jgi:hypothetical protein
LLIDKVSGRVAYAVIRFVKISCGPSAERHLRAIRKFTEAGFDHIVLVQIGPDQDYFFDLFKHELAAALRG